MQPRENILRAVRFETPETIPMGFHINPACWHHYSQAALQDMMAAHPMLYPDFTATAGPVDPEYSLVQLKDHPYKDPWGCVWHTMDNGITGAVTEHPLADWAAFDTYQPPDPEKTDGLVDVDWEEIDRQIQRSKTEGSLVFGGLRHGHTFLQLSDIRGYQALTFDMADNEPRLHRLIQMVEDFNLAIIQKFLGMGAEWMSYPEDLGMQNGPMLSPKHFHKYIKPSFTRLMQPALNSGCIVHMHSDGDIRLLVDDMIDSGVEVINLQDLVNGIDWIANRFAGKVCIDLDVDRQEITYKGSPKDVDDLILTEIKKLGRKEGGLMLGYGMYPGIPIENAWALMDAMEKYCAYYS
jgi:uroporphyrinogen decarboxylase